MNRLARALASAALQLRGAQFAVIGGIAVSARTEPRFTRDIDLAVAVADDAAAESLVHRMIASGFRIATVVEQDAVDRLATVRLQAPGEADTGVVIDLLFASSGLEPEIARAAEPIEVFAGVVAPVARAGHLIALKVLSRDDDTRPQDAADLRALLLAATADDLKMARDGVQLISDRGFHRERDLHEALETAIAAYRSTSG